MAGDPRIREYYGYLFLTAAMAAGAVLANNFVPLVFFWEGLLITLYALITIGGKELPPHRGQGFLIGGFCDFCMILGIAILWSQTGTLRMSDISVVPQGLTAVSFYLMMIGAIGKAGSMPFHTWIPDAAIDAPVAVMAFIPAALEKLLGIYLLARICLDFFKLEVNSPFSLVLMTIGALTIVLAVFMALIQKDLKKLLSYHAVSQVGYMMLGIGTAVPIGIAGGIFHMINHAMYKSGLFLAAGSVEQQTGTTELKKLGGLYRAMPLTALGFLVCAAAISGIWPLNGFVSKEMIFHGSYETGYTIFTIAAWLGAILTFASFLKAGHSVFFGPRSLETAAGQGKQEPDHHPDPGPGRPVRPVRRLQRAAPEALHPAHPGRPPGAGRDPRLHRPRPGRVQSHRPDLHGLPADRPGPAHLRLQARRQQGLPGFRTDPPPACPAYHLRLGRGPRLRPVRTGHQVPAGPVQVSCSDLSTGPSTFSMKRSWSRVGRACTGVAQSRPQRILRQLPGLDHRRAGAHRLGHQRLD